MTTKTNIFPIKKSSREEKSGCFFGLNMSAENQKSTRVFSSNLSSNFPSTISSSNYPSRFSSRNSSSTSSNKKRQTPTPLAGNAGLAILAIGNDTDVNINNENDKGTGIPSRDLTSVQFSDRITGHITGVNGLVLKTTDGGYHWNKESDGGGTSAPIIALADGEATLKT